MIQLHFNDNLNLYKNNILNILSSYIHSLKDNENEYITQMKYKRIILKNNIN